MEIKIRKAEEGDIDFLFLLRNQPSTYQYAKNAKPVELPEHLAWVKPVIEGETEKNLFVLEVDGDKAGQVRIDVSEEQDQGEISISLMPAFQGKGIAKVALDIAMDKMKKERGIKLYTAQIHQDNIPSQKLFEKMGFEFKNQEDVWKTYVKRT